MTIETKYIANDGTAFDTERECEEYECANTVYRYLGWDDNYKRVTGKDLGEIGMLYYVGVPTAEAYGQFNTLSELMGYEKLPSLTNFYPAVYHYNVDTDDWEDFGALCNEYMTKFVAMMQEMGV